MTQVRNHRQSGPVAVPSAACGARGRGPGIGGSEQRIGFQHRARVG